MGDAAELWVGRATAPGGSSTVLWSAANSDMTDRTWGNECEERARVNDVDLAGAWKRIQIAMATVVGRHMRITPIRAEPKIGEVQRGPTTHIRTDTHIGACVRPAAGATESTSIMHSPRTRYQGASSRRSRCRCRPIRCRVVVVAAATKRSPSVSWQRSQRR